MKIIIAGAGEVGLHLAKLLSREEQDIILIDSDSEKLAVVEANYNLMTLVGSPSSFNTLSSVNMNSCDLFIAVTPFETNNVVACSIAKNLGAKRTVARIDNYEFMTEKPRNFFKTIGVDSTIYPEYLAAQEIVTALRHTWVRHWFELHDGEIILLGVKLRAGASFIGKPLRDITYHHHNFHVSAIRRRHDIIIPRGNDFLKEGDIVYFTTTRAHVDELRELCGKKTYTVKNVMIMGGSRIAVRLANLASDEFRFKIIDNSQSRCQWLSERCPPQCDIIFGDGRDNDVLIDEGIEDMDAFVALSDSSETNILACLATKEFGVGKSIAEVENIQFISEAEALNIGTIINKKLLASSKIFQLMLDADTESSKCLALADAEVAEIEVKANSKVTRGPVKDLNLSHDMTIAGLLRDGKGMLVSGNTVLMAGDHVVIFCLSGALHKIEKLFS